MDNKFDTAIIHSLRQDARQSVSNIAEQVNLSRSAVAERIKKTRTDWGDPWLSEFGESQKKVSAYFEIQHQCPRCADVVRIPSDPRSDHLPCISGDMDLLVYMHAPSMRRLHEIREYIDTQISSRSKPVMVMSKVD